MTQGLSPAHRGYEYQDVATAYFLARSIPEPVDGVTVDHKVHPDDIFDDLTIRAGTDVVRRQFKSSGVTTAFRPEHFRTTECNLRIDDMLRAFCNSGAIPHAVYRVCATWDPPVDGDVKRQLFLSTSDN